MQKSNVALQIGGLILTLVLAIGLVNIPRALADLPKVQSGTVEETGSKMKLTVTTDVNIPKKANGDINSVLGFGFAWLDGSKAIVAAIHPQFDDSNQNPKAWHTHTVEIAGDGCVQVDKSQSGVVINGKTMTLQFPKEFAGNIDPTKVASFKLVADSGCDSGAKVEVLSGPINTS